MNAGEGAVGVGKELAAATAAPTDSLCCCSESEAFPPGAFCDGVTMLVAGSCVPAVPADTFEGWWGVELLFVGAATVFLVIGTVCVFGADAAIGTLAKLE